MHINNLLLSDQENDAQDEHYSDSRVQCVVGSRQEMHFSQGYRKLISFFEG